MRGFSTVDLAGNLSSDPLIGESYVKFTVAVETWFKGNNGPQKATSFVPITVFGAATQSVEGLVKGDYVIVNGSLRTSKKDDGAFLMNVIASKVIKLNLAQGNYDSEDQEDAQPVQAARKPVQNTQNVQKPAQKTQYPQKTYSKPYTKPQTTTAQPQDDDIPYDDDADGNIPF